MNKLVRLESKRAIQLPQQIIFSSRLTLQVKKGKTWKKQLTQKIEEYMIYNDRSENNNNISLQL